MPNTLPLLGKVEKLEIKEFKSFALDGKKTSLSNKKHRDTFYKENVSLFVRAYFLLRQQKLKYNSWNWTTKGKREIKVKSMVNQNKAVIWMIARKD